MTGESCDVTPAAASARYRRHAADTGLPDLDRLPGDAGIVLSASEFVWRGIRQQPEIFRALVESGDLDRAISASETRENLVRQTRDCVNAKELGAALRRARWRAMLRIAWRDLGGLSPLAEVLEELSNFADAVVDIASARLADWLAVDFGEPRDAQGEAQTLTVIALGKHGARELNFSSDIDLIFAFPANGQTEGGRRTLANEQFFTRLGRALIDLLHASTELGRVFRVDMRLRPFGNSGPLVISHAALEEYYQRHGRDWERYAFIRARVVAGNGPAAEHLMERLRPFVYRRYIDFGGLESMREMKRTILEEVERQDLHDDLKRGAGGIREVEFVVQAFQLVRGGRIVELRDPRLMPVLARLGELGLLPPHAVKELSDAYQFLRRAENRLQEYDDAQRHKLPADDDGRARLALAMGCAGWAGFVAELERHREHVRVHFEQVFGSQPPADPNDGTGLRALWWGEVADQRAHAILIEHGFADPQATLDRLRALRDAYATRRLSERGRRRLDALVPTLLDAVCAYPKADRLLARVLAVIEAIGGRSVYLSLLNERPLALSQLLRLCDASVWIATEIAAHPVLLDELLDPRILYAPLDRRELDAQLDHRLRTAAGDPEQELDLLRQFKHAQMLRVAAADVAGDLDIAHVSDHLTAIAECCLNAAVRLAWRDLTGRFGEPRAVDECGNPFTAALLVIAYGKFGGYELGYGSDLDLVFMHTSEGGAQHTDGAREIDNPVFFARLCQRIIHNLTTRTPQGALYEVDARLRPSGKSGLLVTSVKAYADYQNEKAWTWEHQALVRARAVVGPAEQVKRFDAIRASVLSRRRDRRALREEVRAMRERMRAELGGGNSAEFDLKQGSGGIADIEFMVQYAVLRWPDRLADALRYSDNLRLLDGIATAGLLPESDCTLLKRAYLAFRQRGHGLFLANRPARVGADEFGELRGAVRAIWRRWFEPGAE